MKKVLVSTIFLAASLSGAQAEGLSVEVYGGPALDTVLYQITADEPTSDGKVLGVGVYSSNFGMFELGIDMMFTQQEFAEASFENTLYSGSLMLVGRYPLLQNNGFTAYAGAGLGAISVSFDGEVLDDASDATEVLLGGQVSLGGRIQTGKGAIFTELKHQLAFEDLDNGFGNHTEYNSTSVMLGYRFDF